jgi:hypothetical protein
LVESGAGNAPPPTPRSEVATAGAAHRAVRMQSLLYIFEGQERVGST